MGIGSRRSFLAAGVTLAVGGLAAACTRPTRPPLDVLYGPVYRNPDQPPLVLIPGAFGSSLRDRRSGREIWPASNAALLLSDYSGLEVEIDPATLEGRSDSVEAYEVFRAGLGRDFYGRTLDTLRDVGRYAFCRPGHPRDEHSLHCYVYAYDWRMDNVPAVRGLDALIQAIRADFGDPSLKVDILAHSNGGLLARYYARYGTADLPTDGDYRPTCAGAHAIRRLLVVGTPNLGTLQPVLSHVRGEEIGLRRVPREVVATCAGAPQMFPHPAVPWLCDLDGRDPGLDLYDVGTWRELRWSIFDRAVRERTIAGHGGGAAGRKYHALLAEFFAKCLGRGRAFMESLSTPAPADDAPLYVFGGDCDLTSARLVLEPVGRRLVARESPERIAAPRPGVDYAALMYEPGDAVVTRSSLLGRRSLDVARPRQGIESLRVAHSVFLCERHQQLTGNPSYADNLLHALLSVEPP